MRHHEGCGTLSLDDFDIITSREYGAEGIEHSIPRGRKNWVVVSHAEGGLFHVADAGSEVTS